MLQPHQLVSIQLSAAQWQTVLTQLARGPYRKVAGLMAEISAQAQSQQEQLAPFLSPSPAPVPDDTVHGTD